LRLHVIARGIVTFMVPQDSESTRNNSLLTVSYSFCPAHTSVCPAAFRSASFIRLIAITFDALLFTAAFYLPFTAVPVRAGPIVAHDES